jgi:hypothetical protein
MLELHPALRQGIDVGRLDRGVTIDPAIVPVHVIGNDENEVWFLSGERRETQGDEWEQELHF